MNCADWGTAEKQLCRKMPLTSFMFLIRLSGIGGLAGFADPLVSLTVDSVFASLKKLFSLTGLVSRAFRLSCSCGSGEKG